MRAGSCIHYAGMLEEKICARGIDVRKRFEPRWPCWTGNTPPESSAVCPFYEEPTAEQLAAHKMKADAAVGRMFAAMVAIEEWEAGQPKTRPLQGSITCPCCQQALDIVVTESHLYAQCATAKCVEFRGNRRGMER
jgi:hypothetical protein